MPYASGNLACITMSSRLGLALMGCQVCFLDSLRTINRSLGRTWR